MTITQMECFVEAARYGSFTKAGEALYISQQTVSRHIRALETELGFSLFERKNRGSVLTAAGRCLFEKWDTLLEEYQTSLDQARDIYYGEQKRLRIGILDNCGIYIDEILETLLKFEKHFPDLEIEYEILPIRKLITSLDSGKLQMVILYRSELEKIPGIKSLPLQKMRVNTGIFISERHPLARRQTIRLKDLCGTVIGMLSDEASLDYRERVRELMRKYQIEDQVQFLEYSSRQNLGIALLAGKCITISYRGVFENMEGKLRFFSMGPEAGTWDIAIAWRDDKYAVKAKNIKKLFDHK